MACEVDSYTKRPRTPNDPYTEMTDEQVRNIKQNRSTFFHFEPASKPKECKARCSVKRYSRIYSQSLVRDLERTCDAMYIDDQIRPQAIPRAHNTCRGLAAVKWGPMKLGERTRGHFFGEQVESFTNIDMYRRPATTYTGRVVMDYGRPGDGYYTQRFPNRASWNCSSAPLNCTNVLHNTYRKTTAEYKEILDAEKTARLARRDEWPEYSTYTAGYLLKENLPEEKKGEFNFEATKKHAALGQRLQAEEQEKAEQKRREKLHERYCPEPPPAQKTVVCVMPSNS